MTRLDWLLVVLAIVTAVMLVVYISNLATLLAAA